VLLNAGTAQKNLKRSLLQKIPSLDSYFGMLVDCMYSPVIVLVFFSVSGFDALILNNFLAAEVG